MKKMNSKSFRDSNIFLLGVASIIFSVIALSQCENIKFKLSATNLPNRDLDGASDPIARMWKAEGNSSSFHLVGSTEKIDNNANPVWAKIFTFLYTKGTNQRWRFFIKDWDLDCLWLFEDFLGHVEISVDEYVSEVQRTNGPMELALTHPSGGMLKIIPVAN